MYKATLVAIIIIFLYLSCAENPPSSSQTVGIELTTDSISSEQAHDSIAATFETKQDALALAQAHCERVLDLLWQPCRNQFVGLPPKITVINEWRAKNAAYFQKDDGIVIELRAYNICLELGENALSFLIGHELGHYVLEGDQILPSSFLRYAKARGTGGKQEGKADLFGAFTAYLAGFQLQDILPTLIDRLYTAYLITDDKANNDYPPKRIRKQAAVETEQLLAQLIFLFEQAQTLSAIGRYQEAADAYKLIACHYHGKEILNNVAANYLLWALDGKERGDSLLFPVELDGQTWLNVPLPDKLAMPSSPVLELAQIALDTLTQALRIDPTYMPARVNRMCAAILCGQGKYDNALADFNLIASACKEGSQEFEMARLALAILLEKQGKTAEALDLLKMLEKSPVVAEAAGYNLEVLTKGWRNMPAPDKLPARHEKINLTQPGNLDTIKWENDWVLGLEVFYSKKASGDSFAIFKRYKQKVEIQHIYGKPAKDAWLRCKTLKNPRRIMLTRGAYFLVFPELGEGFRFEKGRSMPNFLFQYRISP